MQKVAAPNRAQLRAPNERETKQRTTMAIIVNNHGAHQQSASVGNYAVITTTSKVIINNLQHIAQRNGPVAVCVIISRTEELRWSRS
jgi:hypothetical protein